MANDQATFSIEETQGKTTETTVSKKVFSAKRPHETKTFRVPCRSPSDNSPTKIAKVLPTKCTPTKDTRYSTPSSKICNCRWVEMNNKQRDQEILKLQRNLQKCKDELREEVEKRGMSSAGRTASDQDRSRLLSEIKQLGVSKRRLESALEASQVAVKKMEGEVKAVRETCKLQLASVERSSALEVKKLLEDLKVKDLMLASLDRNQYSDRSVQSKIVQQKQQQQQQQQIKEQLQKDIKKEMQLQLEKEMEKKLEVHLLQQQQQYKKQNGKDSKSKQEKINSKNVQISSLKSEIERLETEIKSITAEKDGIFKELGNVTNEKKKTEENMELLKVENEKMSQTLIQLQDEVSSLHESLAESSVEEVLKQFEDLKRETENQKCTIEELENKNKWNKSPAKVEQTNKKIVRFMLPDSRSPIVNGRIAYKKDMRFLFFDEEEDEGWHENNEELYKPYEGQRTSLEEMSESCDEIKGILSSSKKTTVCSSEDYTKLMNDHVRLEKAYSKLSTKKIKDWTIERESLNMAILALEGKNQEYEDALKKLLLHVDEIKDKNEELEFQVLELEGTRGDDKEHEEREGIVEELKQKNRILEDRVIGLSKAVHLKNELQTSIDTGNPDKSTQYLIDGEKGTERVKKMDELTEFEPITLTTSTTSGVEDLSSDDDEASLESMPHDNEPQNNLIPCYNESMDVQKLDDTTKQLTKVVGNLELRLACSKLRENSLLDKIALLCEEKKRLISDSARSEEGVMDEYVVIAREMSKIGRDGSELEDSGVVEDFSGMQENNDNEENESRNEKINSVDVKKVAAKLKKKSLFEKSSEEMQWIEECLRLDTPTRENFGYSHYFQSFTDEGDSELFQQKVVQLEKECDAFREVVDIDEGVIRDLQIKIFDLKNSEKNLQNSLEKLEEVVKALGSSKDELDEDNEKMRKELTRVRSSEELMQSSLDISKSNEKQLKKKLDEVSQDLKEAEKKLRKKTAVAEKLEEIATQSNEKFEDQVGELEAVLELFKKRNFNLERLCEDLNGKLMEAEKQSKRLKLQAECMEQQRDTFVTRIQNLERERAVLLEKIISANKGLEEKGAQLEMTMVERKGLTMRLESLEMERNELVDRLEGQKDVEIIMMKEMQSINDENFKLKQKLICRAQEKRLFSINSESQTSFDDSYQEESSQHYNEYESDEMKISLTMLGVHGANHRDDSIDEAFGKFNLRKSKSLTDLNFFVSHKLTQTSPPYKRTMLGFSMIPINLDYHKRKVALMSRPPLLSRPVYSSNESPLLGSH